MDTLNKANPLRKEPFQIAEVVNAPRMRSPFDDDLGRPGKTTTFFYVKKVLLRKLSV